MGGGGGGNDKNLVCFPPPLSVDLYYVVGMCLWHLNNMTCTSSIKSC